MKKKIQLIFVDYLFLLCVWQASADMEEIFLFIDNLNKRLARGIKDLDDVRSSMAALSEIRESEIRFVFLCHSFDSQVH